MKEIEVNKYIALLEEFETSDKLIRLGFGELQNISLNNDFYFLPFQLLSQGFERYLKAYICIGHFNKYQKLPDYKYLKTLGHDLEKLLEVIINNYFADYKTPQFCIDKDFICVNIDLKELLFILSEFGKLSRYHNFDIVTENTKTSIDTRKLWSKFESKILDKTDFEKLLNFDLSHEVFYKVANYIIVIFEKFISTLSRQFIFKCLGQQGLQLSASTTFDFGMLYEKDFGKTDYRSQTTKFKETPKKVHKRNIFDKIQRKFHPEFKSKKICKGDYQGDWPFYANEIIVECRHKHWCIVTIDGYDYALNGSAKGRYKLENPHDAGMAVLGKSISGFITIAFNLQENVKQ